MGDHAVTVSQRVLSVVCVWPLLVQQHNDACCDYRKPAHIRTTGVVSNGHIHFFLFGRERERDRTRPESERESALHRHTNTRTQSNIAFRWCVVIEAAKYLRDVRKKNSKIAIWSWFHSTIACLSGLCILLAFRARSHTHTHIPPKNAKKTKYRAPNIFARRQNDFQSNGHLMAYAFCRSRCMRVYKSVRVREREIVACPVFARPMRSWFCMHNEITKQSLSNIYFTLCATVCQHLPPPPPPPSLPSHLSTFASIKY